MEMPSRRGITFIPDQGVTEQGVHVQVKYMYLIMILDPDHKVGNEAAALLSFFFE